MIFVASRRAAAVCAAYRAEEKLEVTAPHAMAYTAQQWYARWYQAMCRDRLRPALQQA